MKKDILKHYIEVPDNLFTLLSRYRVVIPGIQRHYVQGANNPKAESVRKLFIKEIFTAIEKKQNEFNLHFIYGPINTNGEDSFVPVDGQQRLTTLWLIARYAVEKAESSDRKDLLRLLSRFTYEDRINAKRFCQALTCEDSRWNITQDPNPNILCQDWFVDYWKEDETVASMIRMLSTIHEEWNKHQDTITAEDILEAIASKIRFELKIDAFGDDIYMKMNARGLQLTQWENFKGKFSEDLCEDKKEWWVKEMEELSNRFFTCSDEQHELPDNAFFALYARIMAYEAKKTGVDCGNGIKELAAYTHNTWSQIELPFVPYSDFLGITNNESIASTVAATCVKMIKTVLDRYQEIVPYFGDRTLFETFFHPKNKNDLDFTLCCYEYFKKFDNIETKDFLKALRLMWNILENVDRQNENPDNRVELVKKFIDLGDQTLYSPQIKEIEKEIEKAPEQAKEEAEKAKQMHCNDPSMPSDWNEKTLGRWSNWNDAIEKAENWAFFHGSIRFLYRKSNGENNWENFATKLSNCMDLFTKDGLSEEKKVKTNQVLISHCKEWDDIRREPVFDTKKESWKQVLTETDVKLSEYVNGLLLSPNEIVDNHNEIIQILIDDAIWKNLIKETPGYELEWKANSPSLWLNRYLYLTLKLTRDNHEDILDAFIGESKVTFDAPEEERYRTIKGKNYYFAVPMWFTYKYKGKEYHFAWQTLGNIDMYDNGWERLFDQYDGEMANNFTIHIDKETDHDSSYYIKKIEKCIDCYEKIHNK